MFDTELKVETKDAARILAVGKCLVANRGKLLFFPAEKEHASGTAVWAGLITELNGAMTYDKREYPIVTCLGGRQFSTSLTLKEAMALVAGGVP